ncbi:MAG: UPF0182 family protein [Elusimicrobia bacterium]|nr:UPF0182 family protein [Elusimicrobiota bacterium]
MPKSLQQLGIILYLALFVGVAFLNKIVGLAADYLWFQEVKLTPVFMTMLLSKWGLGLSCAAAAWLAIQANLLLARRRSHHGIMVHDEDEALEIPRLGEFRGAARTVLLLGSLAAAFLVGAWAAAHWDTVLLFRHAAAFGSRDPVFDRDIGFYVFTLPFLEFLKGFLQGTVLLAGLAVLALYAVEGEFLLTNKGLRTSPSARNHLAFLGGLLCLLAAFHLQLKMYGLLNMQRPVAPGPGYADLAAYLPALKGMRFIAVFSALLLWASPYLRNAALALAGIGLLAAGGILSSLYSGLVQRFIVAPNEIVKETPYIKWAIEHTRRAYGIEGVQELEFDPTEDLTPKALARNDLTIKNIRLWDHGPLLTTYGQLQEIRTYYDFMDVDNDRYHVNGEYRQVMLSPRELNPAALPSRIWINEHLTYTHGYGLTLGPVNRISPEGLPEFFIKDIPPQASTDLKVTRPEVYYGEAKGSYVIVNTRSKEFDYPSGDENIYSDYGGTGGVSIYGVMRKLLFALRFKELKILFSGDITPQSRILYSRNIRERLAQAAPYLRYDQDAYLVLSREGRLFWLVDAYTTTAYYPYSESIPGIGNYIRNSVKAVVDAYNGDISFYVADDGDPIIRTYARVFPAAFKPLAEMPQDLRSHLRYPQDLFSIQAHIYGTYHMTDPQVFYNKEDLWKIPEKSFGGQAERMAPYYTIMKLASVGKKEEFILMVPFTPARKENMIAWMAARCDAPDYGKLLVYDFPKQKLVYGPQQIESRIDQEAEISKQLTLWNQGGSKVIRGSLLVIPVESSLIYVQPLYLEATGGGLPELKRVIVAYGNSIAMEENLEESLNRIFGGRTDRPAAEKGAPDPKAAGARELAQKAREHFDRAQSHLQKGDWTGYGQEMKEVERCLKRLAP